MGPSMPRVQHPNAIDPPPSAQAIAELERVMADGWPALETDRLGDWLLRAGQGWTRRANSVLVQGDPGRPLPEAVQIAERWYAARALPAQFALPVSADADGTTLDEPLARLLAERFYALQEANPVLVADVGQLPALAEGMPPVTADGHLQPGWLEAFAAYRPIVPGVTEQVLTGSAGQLFLSVPDPDRPSGPLARPLAIARMSVAPGWAGVHAMWVDPQHRRRGLATALLAAVATLGGEHHMPRVYLQVDAANPTALEVYQRLGCTVHHGYRYAAAS